MGTTPVTELYFRIDLFLLGIFMRLHASIVVFHSDQKTFRSGKNQRRKKIGVLGIYHEG